MSRSQRLFELLQLLRRHHYPVTATYLAEQCNVTVRTIYRDIASLKVQGADIQGEAGIGYLLKPGFLLPPLMFLEEELEALVLGTRWVAQRTDSDLQEAAQNAMAKIAAVLPKDLRATLEATGLLIPPGDVVPTSDTDLAELRKCMRNEIKVRLAYTDQKGHTSNRVIWPVAIGYFEQVRILVAWCDLRGYFRLFRCDRITEVTNLGERYPRYRQQLLKEWRANRHS